MKLKFFLLAAAAFVFNANAGIIDNEDNLDNSFKDTDTGLVWMDFGVNNNQSFSYVASQLDEGEEYQGWRLPTTEEVYTMWANLADLDNVIAEYESPNNYGPGQLVAHSDNSNAHNGDDSVWDSTFDAVGYNTAYITDPQYEITRARALFLGNTGLAYVVFADLKDKVMDNRTYQDTIILRDGGQGERFRNNATELNSTLLIKITDVPEPSSIGMFALVLLGLGAKRRRLI